MKQIVIIMSLALCRICCGDVIYGVTVSTAGLIGSPSGPFAVDFQLTSGDVGSGTINAVTLSQFTLGGGSAGAGGPFPDIGNASGDLESMILLDTSGGSFFNEISQTFTPGNTLKFQVHLTNKPQPTGIPDEFTFQIVDETGAGISTTDPTGANALVVIDLIGGSLQPQIFNSNRVSVSIAASPQAAPEPGAFILGVIATLFITICRHFSDHQVKARD